MVLRDPKVKSYMTDQWKTKLTLIERAKTEPEDIETWDEFIKFYEPFIKMLLSKHRIIQCNLMNILNVFYISFVKLLGVFCLCF